MVGKTKRKIEYINLMILISFEILLTFTAFGYFSVNTVSLTLVYMPVMLAAYYFGIFGGIVLGSVYGCMSIWGASIATMSQSDQMLTFSMTNDVAASLVLGVASRIAFGVIAALLFKLAKRFKKKKFFACTAAALATALHNVIVYGIMYAFFGYMTYRFYIKDLILQDIVPVVLLNSLLMYVFFRFTETPLIKQLSQERKRMRSAELSKGTKTEIAVFFTVMLLFTASLIYYFLNKIKITFISSRQIIPYSIYSNCMHLGIQFVLAIMSLLVIVCCVIVFFIKLSEASERKSELDPMTRVYNKTAVEAKISERLQASRGFGRMIMLDIDDFKKYNDSYGHLFGDRVLLGVSEAIKRNVSDGDVIGRLGGDEFCIFLVGDCDEDYTEKIALALREDFSKIDLPETPDEKITCSIGISSVRSNSSFKQLYHEADTAMYRAKYNGKNNYMFFEHDSKKEQ